MKVASIRKCNLTAGNPPDDCTAFVSPVDSTLLAYLRKLLGCPICPRTGARQYYKLRPELRRISIPRTSVNKALSDALGSLEWHPTLTACILSLHCDNAGLADKEEQLCHTT